MFMNKCSWARARDGTQGISAASRNSTSKACRRVRIASGSGASEAEDAAGLAATVNKSPWRIVVIGSYDYRLMDRQVQIRA
jgi:hypothetical protein